MQRTLKEVYNLLKQKVENAKIDLEKSQLSNLVFPCTEKIFRLRGLNIIALRLLNKPL